MSDREMAEEQASLPGAEPSCPGCQGAEPVVLPCGHSLCESCLQLCRGELGESACTVCYGRDVLDSVVKGLLDSLFQGQPRRDAPAPEELCPLHGVKMTLYCVEDEVPICSICSTGEHEDHECCSVHEAMQECKRELKAALKPLQEKLEALNVTKQTCDEMAEHIKSQSLQTERLVKEEFEKLHQFLREEEASLVASLKEEEEQKSQKLRDRIEKMAEEIATLTDTIKMAEDDMEAEDICFLQNFKATVERYMTVSPQFLNLSQGLKREGETGDNCNTEPVETEVVSGVLIDVAKHLGSLKHHAWEKMQGIVQYSESQQDWWGGGWGGRGSPVVLDPNTADVCLIVSDDLTSVRYTDEEQRLPDNPERFNYYECVLGSEGFSSGRHTWDVDVGDSSEWALGVAKETVVRKEWFPLSPERGLWSICLYAGEYRARAPISSPIAVKKKPHRVRVQLDWDRGRLAFSDPSDNSLLYKFQHRFTERVFPYFSNTCKRHPLRILPGRVSVTTD
ncbi:hypothetical protein JZ751_009098 [Albula glossodonta]|uniref:Uncharacterized protein n=1 Tax=Albula glossodonta TaxID=121402 RepID=A0A8T2N8M7_9TELE|nr:hypothetical protein JZ751_009098 [Albula glossodonta]